MLHDVVFVESSAPYRLFLRFDDGTEGTVDVDREIEFIGVFAPLRDPAVFALVRVDPELGTVVWPSGADLDPVVLYARVTGRPITLAPSAA